MSYKASKGNSKLGNILNFNLPAGRTCPAGADCQKFCYAKKGTYNFPAVKNRYRENLDFYLQHGMVETFKAMLAELDSFKGELVRWHSSGDCPDFEYLQLVFLVAMARPKVNFMMFTKRYDWVNNLLGFVDKPDNLTIIFSYDDGLEDEYENPFEMPIAIVSDTTSSCGNQLHGLTCEECRVCWQLKPGEKLYFWKH